MTWFAVEIYRSAAYLEIVCEIPNVRINGDKWQSKTLQHQTGRRRKRNRRGFNYLIRRSEGAGYLQSIRNKCGSLYKVSDIPKAGGERMNDRQGGPPIIVFVVR